MTLSNEVECDEAYVTAGHKGQPAVVKSKVEKAVVAAVKVPVVGAHERRNDILSLGGCNAVVTW